MDGNELSCKLLGARRVFVLAEQNKNFDFGLDTQRHGFVGHFNKDMSVHFKMVDEGVKNEATPHTNQTMNERMNAG